MKAVNKDATKVFLRLIEGMKPGSGKKIDNARGTFMAVSIDFLGSTRAQGIEGTIDMYAIAHRYEQNGDLVPDPDVEFFVMRPDANDDVKVCPTAIDHGPIGYHRYVYFDTGPLPTRLNRRGQADLATFCGGWLKNIKQQQGL